MKEEIETAKQVIIEELKENNLEVEEIFLFGSKAKGDFNKDSDWDIFVVVDKNIDIRQKRNITAKIRIKLAEKKIPLDVIIQSRLVVEKRKQDVGYLTYYVLKEGIKI